MKVELKVIGKRKKSYTQKPRGEVSRVQKEPEARKFFNYELFNIKAGDEVQIPAISGDEIYIVTKALKMNAQLENAEGTLSNVPMRYICPVGKKDELEKLINLCPVQVGQVWKYKKNKNESEPVVIKFANDYVVRYNRVSGGYEIQMRTDDFRRIYKKLKKVETSES